jgi:hypothetical protein
MASVNTNSQLLRMGNSRQRSLKWLFIVYNTTLN